MLAVGIRPCANLARFFVEITKEGLVPPSILRSAFAGTDADDGDSIERTVGAGVVVVDRGAERFELVAGRLIRDVLRGAPRDIGVARRLVDFREGFFAPPVEDRNRHIADPLAAVGCLGRVLGQVEVDNVCYGSFTKSAVCFWRLIFLREVAGERDFSAFAVVFAAASANLFSSIDNDPDGLSRRPEQRIRCDRPNDRHQDWYCVCAEEKRRRD